MLKKILSLAMAMVMLAPCVCDGPGKNTVYANTVATAQAVSMNTVCTGVLNSENDEMYYKFKATKNSYSVLSFIPNGTEEQIDSGYRITILDSNYNKVFEYSGVTGAFKSGRLQFKNGETFYVKVEAYTKYYDYAPMGVQYQLSVDQSNFADWEVENNNVAKNANSLSLGKAKYGVLWKDTDTDFYKYKITKKGYVQFTFLEEETENEHAWNITFYDKNLKAISKTFYIDGDAFKSPRFNFKKGTTIYVKVEAYTKYSSYAPVDVKYSIKANEVKTKKWEKAEKNNSFKKATTVKSSIFATLYSCEDVDYFKVKVKKNKNSKKGKIKFVVDTDASELGWGYAVRIYNSKKKEITKYTDNHITENRTYKLKAGKTYYVKVCATMASSDAPVDYTYTIEK